MSFMGVLGTRVSYKSHANRPYLVLAIYKIVLCQHE